MQTSCIFCKIIAGEVKCNKVYEDENTFVFLDNGPIFPGHCLICPKEHVDTFLDLPKRLIEPLMLTTQLIGKAVERGLEAEGSFMAVNNKISQSVPHLHVHVIPRRRKDGMKGFFWPRRPYKDESETEAVASALRSAIESLVSTRTE
jgi:histidine triad (HIT) family protein